MILVGIALASRKKARTVLAVLNSRTRECQLHHEAELVRGAEGHAADPDAAMLAFCVRAKVERVGLDAPLSFPAAVLGRLPVAGTPDYLARACDKESGGFATLSPGVAPVAARGMYLRHRLHEAKVAVDEVSPRASLLAFGIPAKLVKGKRAYTRDLAALRQLHRELHLDGAFRLVRGKVDTPDELNAVIAVLTLLAPPEDTRLVGDPAEGQIRVPARRFWE